MVMMKKFIITASSGVFLLSLFFITLSAHGAEAPLVRKGYFNNFAQISLFDRQINTIERLLKKYHEQSGNEVIIVTGNLPYGATAKDFAEKTYAEWHLDKAVVIAVAVVPDSQGTYVISSHYESFVYIGKQLREYLTEKEAKKISDDIILPWMNGNESFYAFLNAAYEVIRVISKREDTTFDFTQIPHIKYHLEHMKSISMDWKGIIISVFQWIAVIVVLVIVLMLSSGNYISRTFKRSSKNKNLQKQ